MEYVDVNVSEPNVVFYWGLNPARSNFTDIESVEEDFLRNIYSGYHGIHRNMVLAIVHASELPKNAQFDAGNGKKMKACWKILDYSQRRIPLYSQHLPNYFVGYVASNGDINYPNTGG